MTSENSSNDHTLYVFAFLGGTTFAALSLLIQSKNLFEHADVLITLTSIMSVLFIFATLARLRVAKGQVEKGSPFSNAASYFGVIGLYGLLVILIFTVWQITLIGGIVVLMIIAISICIFQKLKTRVK